MRTIKKIFESMSINQLKAEITQIKSGCGKKINSDGDCFYYSSFGNLRLCSTCSKNLKQAQETLKEKTKR